ncbi:hypothetical protein D3C73_989120 [compost metagenome]
MQRIDYLAANKVKIAADLNPLGQQHQSQQGNNGAPVDKTAERRQLLRINSQHQHPGHQQNM